MDIDKFSAKEGGIEVKARIERDRYVLAVYRYGRRTYYNEAEWTESSTKATKYSTQRKAVQAVESYGRRYHGDNHSQEWELWLITEVKPISPEWAVDSERQII